MNAADATWRMVPSVVFDPSLQVFEKGVADPFIVKSDEELILLVGEKNEAAFEVLVDRYMQDVHRFAYRFCQDRTAAEDLTQETFLRVWQRASTWVAGKVKFTTWIHQIARNLCIDLYRKKVPEVVDENAFENIPSTSSDKIEAQLVNTQIQRAVGSLPERQRTAFVFCQIQGWSQVDVANVMDTSVNAVEGLLARARRTLRVELAALRRPY